MRYRQVSRECNIDFSRRLPPNYHKKWLLPKKKNGKPMSGFFKIRDFFLKSVLRKTAEFSVSDTGDPLILTCLLDKRNVKAKIVNIFLSISLKICFVCLKESSH